LLLIVSIYFSAFWQPELCLIVAVLSAPPRIVIRKFQPQLIALGCLLSSFPAMSLDKTSCRIRLIPLSRRILFCITFLCAERVLPCGRNRGLADNRLPHRSLYRREHGVGCAEAHLGFCRVNVHVNVLWQH